tara:strand:+ start:334 stop:942 length:609 start_codon:yes stop_codon:yes gene_type:complete
MRVGDRVHVSNHVIIIALKMLEKPAPAAMPDKSFIEGTIVEDEEDGDYIVDFGKNKIGTTTIGKLSLAGWSIGKELDLEKAEQAIKQRMNALTFAQAIQKVLDTPTQPPPSSDRATRPPPSYEEATRKGGGRKKRRKKTKNKKGGVVPRRTLQRQNAIIPQPTRRLHIQMPKSKTQKNRKKRIEMRRAKALSKSKVYSSNKK